MKVAFRFAGALVALMSAACARAESSLVESPQSRVRPFSMERAEQWTLKSKAGRIFEISVSRPKAAAPASGYPVLYVLDPGTAFATLADTVRNHEKMFGPVVVVGVGYPSDAEGANRTFDLTPTTDAATLPKYRPEGWGAIGGADAFFAFIQDELKPEIGKRALIDKRKQALFGHSLGGLFVLHVLFTHPEAFEAYIAGSPSIWWGGRVLLNEVTAFKASQRKGGKAKRLLITMGELEAKTSPEELRLMVAMKFSNPEELMRNANMLGNAAALAEDLKPLSAQGLEVVYTVFPNETHNSVIPAYLSRGARFTLSGWFK